MNTDIYRRLAELLPADPVLSGHVVAVHADGTATVGYPGGAQVRVRDPFASTQGAAVYVRGGVITGPAPDLGPAIAIEI